MFRRTSIHNPSVWDVLYDTTESHSGETVNCDSTLSVPAVWQAVGMISGDVSKLPLEVYRRDGKDRQPDTKHPARLIIRPDCWANADLSGLILWRRAMVHALLWPRSYVWVDRDEAGRPIGLYNLLPDRTSIEDVDGRRLVVSEIGGKLYPFEPRDTIMIENISLSDDEGWGPIKAARHNIGLQLAKRKFTSRFYGAGCHAGGILQVPPGASEKAVKKIGDSIETHRSGGDQSFRALVLRDGFKWHQVTINPDQAQAGETEEAEIRNVARFYRMAPSRLGVKESISYNSEEAARRAYHDETLSYWLTQIKAECTLKLLTEAQYDADSHFVDYNIHALNWADTNTVISVGVQGVNAGVFNRDEVRRWFNMGPLPDGAGEKFLQPLNMGTVGDEPDDPAEPDDPPEPDENDQQRAAVLAAWTQLATETLERAARRLATGGTPETLQRQAAAMWEPVGNLASAMGLGAGDAVGRLMSGTPPTAIVGEILGSNQA
jgi:HK97 family phage portal protein